MLAFASVVVASSLATLAPARDTGAVDELTLERIFADPPLDGRGPTALQLSPAGKYVTFLRGSEKDSDVLDLWGIRLDDLGKGVDAKPELLVSTEQLLGGKEQKLTEQERMQLERKRISKRGITTYLWCGSDARSLVFPLSGDLYDVTLVDGAAPKVVRLTHDEDKPEMNPTCSKSGAKIAFVKDDAVHVLDVKSGKDTRITPAGSATHHWGLAEFIAEEEMDRHEGMWWSPDEKSLLVFEVDESVVGKKTRAQIFADHTEMFEQRYPAAGEANAKVTAWLFGVDGHAKKLPERATDGKPPDHYLARGGFLADGRPYIEWENREQTFLAVDAFAGTDLVSDHDDAWVELTDDFVPLKDKKHALWSSEKSGRRQIELVDLVTHERKQLTNEPEPVKQIEAVDEDKGLVFYTAWRDRGRQLRVYSVPLAGGASAEITTEAGWHSVTFDDAGRFFVDRASDFGVPPKTALREAATGKIVLVLDDNQAPELAKYAKSKPEWLDLTAADGKTVLSGLLLSPTKMKPGNKYPVITSIYGGPTAQTVTKAWGRGFALDTYWTEHGYGVFLVDNRGMAGRDRAFTRAHKNAFGDVEVADLYAAVQQVVASHPWIDGAHVGVFGWSYGGFLSTRAILDDHTPFAAAASVAPVTDWTLYDTHYTERYIGDPKTNAAAYTKSNLVSRAKLLSKPYLLVHGTADDNVLFEHSLRLIEALEKEDKPFQLMIYPGKAHGISGKQFQLHVYKTITDFFDAKLKP